VYPQFLSALTDFCVTARLSGALFSGGCWSAVIGGEEAVPAVLSKVCMRRIEGEFCSFAHGDGLCIACPLKAGGCWAAFWTLPTPPSSDEAVVRSYVLLLDAIIAIHLGRPKTRLRGPIACHDRRVRRIIEQLEQNLQEVPPLDELASMSALTKSSLCRLFKAETGYSISSYLQILRIEASLALLTDQRLSITQVALRCGYGDPAYFARIFRQTMGISAQQWRLRVGGCP